MAPAAYRGCGDSGDIDACYIKDVAVRPEYQGKGIGRMLINELLKYVSENSISGTDVFIELSASRDNIPFYEKFGFDTNDEQRLKLMYRLA